MVRGVNKVRPSFAYVGAALAAVHFKYICFRVMSKESELLPALGNGIRLPTQMQLSALNSVANDCKYAQAPARAACCLVPGAQLDTSLHTAWQAWRHMSVSELSC